MKEVGWSWNFVSFELNSCRIAQERSSNANCNDSDCLILVISFLLDRLRSPLTLRRIDLRPAAHEKLRILGLAAGQVD